MTTTRQEASGVMPGQSANDTADSHKTRQQARLQHCWWQWNIFCLTDHVAVGLHGLTAGMRLCMHCVRTHMGR